MKKTILIFTLLIPLFNFAQNYTFNLLTSYKSENGFYKERTIFSNKENDSYFLEIKEGKGRRIAYLEDLKNSIVHQFEISEPKPNNNEAANQFVYKNSYKVTSRDITTTHNFKVIKRDSISKTIELITYKNNKIISSAELIIEDSSYNLFSLFRYSCLHPNEEFMELHFNENGIVKSYKRLDSKKLIYIYLDYSIDIKSFELEVKS